MLGRGAMGLVYLAEDPVIGREVAIKAIRNPTGAEAAEVQEMRARFEGEFRSAGTLSHPNIVTVYDVGQEGDSSFIAMEYVKGETLESVMRSERNLSPNEIADLALQLGSALDYAHKRDIVHRDIKPANIMITWDGRPMVTDFGVAKLASSTVTRTGTIIGTPAYMAPEQVTGGTISGASDQFSLGVILYQLLTGERPFSGENPTTVLYKIVHQEPLPPQELNRELPDEVGRVLLRSLKKDPAERYASCTEMARALRQALQLLPPEDLAASEDAEPTLVSSPTDIISRRQVQVVEGRRRRRKRLMQGFVALVVLAVLAGFGWWLSRGGSPLNPRLVQVQTDVPGAEIWIDGRDSGQRTPAQLEVYGLPGSSRQLELRREGQVTARDELVLAQDMPDIWQPQEFWTLERQVQVETTIPGAEIWVDGADTGERTPAEVRLSGNAGVPAALELRREDQVTAQEQLVLTPDLEPRWAPQEMLRVRVDSQPPGAQIRLDGDLLDTTPAAIELRPGGGQQLELSLDGYGGWSSEVSALTPQLLENGLQVTLRPLVRPGFVVVAPGYPVRVSVAGRSYGPRSDHRIPVSPGDYDVAISAAEVFLDLRRQVRVTTGNDTEVSLPPLVPITITANPSNCKISIDGREVDFTPIRGLPVSAGAHTLTFFWPALGKTSEQRETISASNAVFFARP